MTLFALLLASPSAEASTVWTCRTEVEVVAPKAGNRGTFTFDGRVTTAEPAAECNELVGKTHRIVLEGPGADVGTVLSLAADLATHEETPTTSIIGWTRLESSACGCTTTPTPLGGSLLGMALLALGLWRRDPRQV